ncbi:hypothetical protein EVA_08068, partial [gut metagenome]
FFEEIVLFGWDYKVENTSLL